jgi:hypothetical protein
VSAVHTASPSIWLILPIVPDTKPFDDRAQKFIESVLNLAA